MLLVGAKVLAHRGRRERQPALPEAQGIEQVADPLGAGRRRDADLEPDPAGRPKPVRDGLAVEQRLEPAGRLDRVAD